MYSNIRNQGLNIYYAYMDQSIWN